MMIHSSRYKKTSQNSLLLGKRNKLTSNFPVPLLMAVLLMMYGNSHAAEPTNLSRQDQSYAGVYKHKVGSNFTVRGWKLSPNLYLGQTKTFGVTSYGLIMDKGEYAFGVVDQKISIMKSF